MLALPRLALFDLDGTLIDSVPDIAVALDAALAEAHLPEVGEANTRRWVGNGARVLVRRAMAWSEGDDPDSVADPADNPEAAAMYRKFIKHYEQHLCERTTIYPGAREALDFLRENSCRLAVVSNKPEQLAIGVLDALGLTGYFELVLGGDSLRRKKPHPEPLKHIMARLGVPSEQTLLIGDSDNDIAAARAAGIDSICVTYGYNQGRDPHSLGASLVLDTLADLPRHLKMAEKQ